MCKRRVGRWQGSGQRVLGDAAWKGLPEPTKQIFRQRPGDRCRVSTAAPSKSAWSSALSVRRFSSLAKTLRRRSRRRPTCWPKPYRRPRSNASTWRSTRRCKRSASIRVPERCHRVPPKCNAGRQSGSEHAFRRNTAARLYQIEAAHNSEVAGSNPAPATSKGPAWRGLLVDAGAWPELRACWWSRMTRLWVPPSTVG